MKKTIGKTLSTSIALASIFVCQNTLAEHFDVELTGSCAGVVSISSTEAPIDSATNYKIFEAEFGELGSPYGTDDPGYFSAAGVLCPQEILWYEGAGPLEYWNGSTWSTMVTDAEQIHIYGALGEDTIYSSNGVQGNIYGAIDQADLSGSLHGHLEYEIENALGSSTPAVGAYMIPIRLYGDNHSTIETFYIAFNLGMSEVDFDAAIANRSACP